MTTELESSAERLLKWDRRRSRINRILNYDLREPPRQPVDDRSRAWATGEPRAIPALIVASRVWRANEHFCRAASHVLGVETVKDEVELPPHLRRQSSFEDPLVRFPNGLILNTVDAAEQVVQQAA
ncbi:MAG TPA: hypothetical protein VFX79_03445 [Candidatus Saccharimonadales bacterium]|nr:hypothetical protein [Candidatus Saccharimonadales bacterium]